MAREDETRCRGYTVASPAQTAFIRSTWLLHQNFLIPESVGFCRRWGSMGVLVTFETSSPIYTSPATNIGRASGVNWDGFGPGYRGAAIPAEVAQALGIVSGDAIARFRSGGDTREELSDSLVSEERQRQREHRRTISDMRESDEARLDFGREFGETLGTYGANVVNFAGKTFGKTVGAFMGKLGPYGALAIAGVVLVGGAYVALNLKGILDRAEAAKDLL